MVNGRDSITYCEPSAQNRWSSSTGFTAVSKSKPHLSAQWAIGTHCNVPVEWKRYLQNELTYKKFYTKSKFNLVKKQHYDVKPITLIHLQ